MSKQRNKTALEVKKELEKILPAGSGFTAKVAFRNGRAFVSCAKGRDSIAFSVVEGLSPYIQAQRFFSQMMPT